MKANGMVCIARRRKGEGVETYIRLKTSSFSSGYDIQLSCVGIREDMKQKRRRTRRFANVLLVMTFVQNEKRSRHVLKFQKRKTSHREVWASSSARRSQKLVRPLLFHLSCILLRANSNGRSPKWVKC